VGFWGSSVRGAAGSGVAAEAGDSGELGDDGDAKGEDSDESSEENVVGSAVGLSSATKLGFDSTGPQVSSRPPEPRLALDPRSKHQMMQSESAAPGALLHLNLERLCDRSTKNV